MTLHGLAAVSHVSQLVDVEPMKARGQTLNLSSDLHFASRASHLDNPLKTKSHFILYLGKGDSSRDSVTLDYSYSHVNMVGLKF